MSNAKMYKVTIGIPIYNVRNYIEACLTSALNQDFEDIEYILVDGCGTDDSMQLALNLIEKHSRKADVRIIKQEKNLGPGEDRNAIIRSVNSDYLYFLDSDDEMTPNCISLLYSEIVKDNTIDFVGGYNSTIDLGGNIKMPQLKFGIYSNKRDVLNAYLARDISGVMWNKLYRTQFILENNIITIHSMISEDVGFQLQEMYYSRKIVIIPQITYLYYRRKVSLTSDIQVYLIRRAAVLIDLYQLIIRGKMGRECEIILLEYVLMLLYELSTTPIPVKEYTSLQTTIYHSILKDYRMSSMFKNDVAISMNMKICALSAFISNNTIRSYYLLLLGKMGQGKRLIEKTINRLS